MGTPLQIPAPAVNGNPAITAEMFPVAVLLYYGVLTNVLLFCFNLIPIPPLDGSKIWMLDVAAAAKLPAT